MSEMRSPLRENLEIYTDTGGKWVRCTKCYHVLCQANEDWKKACISRLSPPTKAGPLMIDLLGLFLLEQLCCPNCGVLLSTELVEEKKNGRQGRTE